MTSTELTLNRTLTDILEDELYNFHGNYGCGAEHCHSSNVSLNGKSLMGLPLPAFEEFMTNETLATDYNLSPPSQNDLYTGSSSSNLRTTHPGESSISVHALFNNAQHQNQSQHSHAHSHPHQHQVQNLTQAQQHSSNQHQQHPIHQSSHQLSQGDTFKIFNKYADPTLTTTSTHDTKVENKTAHTPMQKTVNLNSIMKIPNPFSTPNVPKTHPPSSPISRDVRVSNDPMDPTDNAYGHHGDEEFLGYGDSYNFKMNWPLQDSSLALSNEDARMIFDHEFQNDDDLSDDEEEDEETFENESRKDIYEVPFGYSNEFNINSLGKQINARKFVDSNVIGSSFPNPPYSDEVILDEEDDDSNMMDEDELYEPSYRNNRKESVVFNRLKETVKVSRPSEQEHQHHQRHDQEHERNHNHEHEHGRKMDQEIEQQRLNTRVQTRRKLSTNESVSSSGLRRNPVSSKKLEPLQDSSLHSPSPLQAHSKHRTSDGNEVYTCMIINPITKHSCSAQFSRSYDLTRHQNTIHAKKKSVFRCSECIKIYGHEGYQKTFSRLDALTRHIKSKHEYLTLEQRQDVTRYARDNIGYVVG